ncbi:replicative DNA helicase [Victivallis vadensis]|uniref:Replicative DNA helicase n=1 Tax=Victivallis vadensis TaxID=172901 RepID=A0A848AZ06_9BACT|nr:replicative DNA helicase [Victivallis vadensis]NMD88478.1 replicative DNA helicase [Victivallis vadensis]
MAEDARAARRPDPANIADRAQPHDNTVERAVLAAMLREPATCVDVVIEHFRDPEVFYSHVHRTIFEAIVELHNDPKLKVDLISVAHRLKTMEKLDMIGGEVFLGELYTSIATAVNLDAWCQILRKYATLRRMIDVCSESLLKCYDSDADAAQLVEQIETDIFKVRSEENTNSIVEIKDTIEQEFHALYDLLDGKTEVGIPTGYTQLDKYTGGLKAGEMFVLAARPSIGKTSLALNVIRNLVLPTRSPHPRKVAFFSLEMTEGQIARRLLCTEAGISESVFWNKTFQSSDLTKLTGAVSAFQKAKLFIDPTGGITIAELRAKARRLKMKEDIDAIVIDYLQLMHADGRTDNRQQEVGEISGGIKALAKDLKIPVLVLAQLNREVDKSNGPAGLRPKLAHLRESGTIEQDADIVTFLHRNRDDAKEVSDPNQSVKAEWIVEKNRNGRTGVIELNFFPTRMEFLPAAPYDEEDCPQ